MLVIEECPNPSSDYYIIPLLENKNKNYNRIFLKDFEMFSINHQSLDLNTIVIVRYLNKKIKQWLANNRTKIEKIIYFMDDDLFDLKALRCLPKRYAWKIFKHAYIYKDWLKKK
ncbi:MAG TPA: hypothetical protein DIT22_05545 [Thermodesulfobacterium commune]|nr:MAG: hypothetical protein XD41_1684 [Desulfonauticus sp. 38_4375]HCP10151.1 hypothetical protein [Thermodesulfobacterium commune]